ncbi:hypothetical protein MHU86_23992 [Fragilaria crotonensis]|nr:hypothetical protein MHU86_23992 [Fragilaria crotonensis]
MKSFIECLPLEDMTASIESHPLEDMSTTDELRQTVTNFFDCTDGLAKLPYKLWRIWHPCSDALPAWLHSCDVYHIAKQRFPPLHHVLHVPASNAIETSLISSVHALYHSIAAECADDSLVCSKLLSTCHTLVVAYPDDTATTRKAVAAISFVLHHPTVVIMYVGVDEEFRAGGLGILLLLLAGKCCIPPLQKVVTCAMMVRVHTEGHTEARRFENRGFKLSTVTTANRGMPRSVAEIVNSTPWMKPHVMNDTNDNAADADAADAAMSMLTSMHHPNGCGWSCRRIANSAREQRCPTHMLCCRQGASKHSFLQTKLTKHVSVPWYHIQLLMLKSIGV